MEFEIREKVEKGEELDISAHTVILPQYQFQFHRKRYRASLTLARGRGVWLAVR
jgi:hypothetical protein